MQRIVACTADQVVASRGAPGDVVSRAAVELVCAASCEHPIVARPAFDQIVARATPDLVVSPKASHHIVAVEPADHIPAGVPVRMSAPVVPMIVQPPTTTVAISERASLAARPRDSQTQRANN